MSDVLNSQDFLALHASIKRLYLQNSNIGAYGLRQGVGSWEQRVKIDGREQGALKNHWEQGVEHPGKKEQGA